MQIQILLFASLREAASVSDLSITLPDGSLAGNVPASLAERFPSHSALLERCAIAVNAEYAQPDLVLQDGDVVAVIPPVSGGSVRA